MSLTPTSRLGPYEIVSPLGAGGMGEVYRAKDTRLDREVAIKVLPERLANDADALSRFEREAKAVAALSHPNILAIYDFGAHNKISYVVTELLEGETLRERLGRAAISWRQAVEISVSVAEGLSAAHAKGVIHRDLKPENIFITTAGHVKILDFGLARVEPGTQSAAGQSAENTPTMTLVTRPGMILGTLNYMSPEQVRGLQTDARSDIFSLGCVVYEMIAGRRAFTGDTAADTMTAILKEEPPGITDTRKSIRPELDRVISRCLEKKPEQRFQSAPDLAFTLRSILADSGATPAAKRTGLGWLAKAGIVALVAAALLVGAFMVRRELRLVSHEARVKIDSLAVLPLENVSRDPEQEYFVDGMTEALISDLAKIGGLKVISRTSVMRDKATTKSLPEIAKELNVDAVMEGSVLRVGDRVRITAQLIHAATDEHLWTESYDRDLSDVLRLQSEVARTIAKEIKVTLTPQEQARMVAARPINPEAYQAYLKGRFYWNKRTPDGLKKAVEYFEQAVALAADWPLGYAGLADAYVLMPEYSAMRPSEAIPKARAAAAKALELDESLGEAHATMGIIASDFDWDWTTAEREFQRALALSPNYATAHQWYAEYLKTMGRHGDAIREITKAQELDPVSLIIGTVAGRIQYYAGNLEQAETRLRKTLDLGPDFALARDELVTLLFLQGRFAEAITEAREVVRLSNNDPSYAATLGCVCANAGQPEEARKILAEFAARSKEAYVAPTLFALVHAGLGERDRMFEWLERAYQERDSYLLYTLPGPLLAPMRSDPRFADLVRRVGLPPLPVPRGSNPPSSPLTKEGDRGVTAGKIMLAVLPFENLSRDPEQEFFSDGLTEEMITQLGRLNPAKLGVIARSSAMHYKNTDRTIEQVSRELRVDYVVEGSVRRAGNRVRITATLIVCSDQSQLWGDSFERELEDVLALQSDVAQAIAREIKVTLTPQEQARMTAARPVNPEAHQAYLKGRFHWNKRTPEGLKKAVDYFEQVVSLAPDWPLGHAGLADAYGLMPYYSLTRPKEAMPKAKAAAAKALELEESLGEAHATLALIANNFDWDWPTAEREFKRAIALSPNYATAHHWYERHLLVMGRYNEAIKVITKAQELDPLSLVISVNVGGAHYFAGNYAQAETLHRQTVELGPDWAVAHRELAITLLARGKLTEATTEAREATRLSGNDPYHAAVLGYACAKAGQREDAQKILNEFTARSTEAYIAPGLFALVHAGGGEKDQMFDWLEKAYQEHDVLLPYLLRDPILAPMRSDPRFADLVRRVGLPPLKPMPESIPSRAREEAGTPRDSAKPLPDGRGSDSTNASSARTDKITLAVLPFANDSGDSELDYLSDGIAETLINGFSRIEAMSTVPRSAAFRHKGVGVDPVQAGRELSATAVLSGRVLKRGENLTIQADLVDVAEGRQLWGERYQRKFDDLVVIERDIAGDITDALRLRLTGEEKRKLSRGYSENAEAYRLYLQGRNWWSKRTKEGFDNALRLLDQAVQIDPTFALAHTGIADTYSLLPLQGYVAPREALVKARKAAEEALRLDDQLAEAHCSVGMVRFYLEWDLKGGEQDFQRAMKLNPRYATAHQWYALNVGIQGRISEARTELLRAIELDPLAPIFFHNLGWISYWERDWNGMLSRMRAGLEFAPEFPLLHQGAGLAFLELGQTDDALAHFRKYAGLAPSSSVAAAALGYGLARTGQMDEARALLAEWIELTKTRYVPPTDIATMYVGLREYEEAFRWLERAYEVRDTWMTFLGVLPIWKPLHSDPRFTDLVRRVGLPAMEK